MASVLAVVDFFSRRLFSFKFVVRATTSVPIIKQHGPRLYQLEPRCLACQSSKIHFPTLGKTKITHRSWPSQDNYVNIFFFLHCMRAKLSLSFHFSHSNENMAKPEIFFKLSEDIIKADQPTSTPATNQASTSNSPVALGRPSAPARIPAEHKFVISDIAHQTLAIFSQGKSIDLLPKITFVDESKNLALEGKVVQKGECRPIGDANYMKLKKESIRIASQPTKVVQKLDRAINNFKPINAHRIDVRMGYFNHTSIILLSFSLTMITERRLKAKRCVTIKMWSKMLCLPHSRNISTTTSKTWNESPNSQL